MSIDVHVGLRPPLDAYEHRRGSSPESEARGGPVSPFAAAALEVFISGHRAHEAAPEADSQGGVIVGDQEWRMRKFGSQITLEAWLQNFGYDADARPSDLVD